MMNDDYIVDKSDLPEDLQFLPELEAVEIVIEYQSPTADYSVILNHHTVLQQVRMAYLENVRDDWEWFDSETNEQTEDGYVILRRRAGR